MAEWDRATGVSTTTGYGWRRSTHAALALTAEGTLPAVGALELLDLIERGEALPGASFGLVDPATASVLDVRLVKRGDRVVAVRTDGTEIVGLERPSEGAEDSAGVVLAGRVWGSLPAAETALLANRWRVPVMPNHERVLAAVREGAYRRTGRSK